MEKEKFYITSAIAYTSRKPHIGNTYEIVLTDAIARFKRLMGYDVFFLTGTDEHGQKIEEIAKNEHISCKEHVDKISGQIRDIWNLMNASYDKFIRTTDDYHEKAVQKIFKKLYDQGDIYKGKYEGMYCVPCETFFTQSQLVDGKCPDCGREVVSAEEEAYFFKMSKYQDALMKHIEEHPDFICPEARRKEMVNNFLKPGLQDLCVSRSSFKWGIPVTFDDKHVIYVWIDALSNYITALGYDVDTKGDLYKKYWPADVHIIGKDILRFHTIYWPIILMALGEPLPKQVFGHPWLLNGASKMSKSLGNVIYADDLVRHFGVDAVRYYVLREMPYAQDGTITYENIIARCNGDLANTLGNLVNRTVAMSNKYFEGIITNTGVTEDVDGEVKDFILKTKDEVIAKMNEFRAADSLELIISMARRLNKYIDETEPWALAKDESKTDRLKEVLYNLLEGIRFIGVLLKPFMPDTSESILLQINSEFNTVDTLDKFGYTKSGTVTNNESPLFMRIDEKKKLEEIEAEVAKAQKEAEKVNKKSDKKEDKKEDKKDDTPSEISIDDFAKINLKVGKVLECRHVDGADKLLVSQIKIGDEVRQIVSGIAKHYSPEDMIGKKVVVVTNLKPVKLRGVLSQGMILAASDENGKLSLVTPDDENLDDGSEVR
ncbi:methionine--tRNA ligase [Qingrenia yutianensis]|uniref:Methionine--tRNA ligase n=1 Tax=Qingrenia yutianensis TaxID=2763676 RepID=A0A926FBM5_9FIRM|nr:methionine--tRNA ligase [Qingrenia yutianensis]MBC8595504.1 methionine--tRNA ligase [Qingrenia yutianensis]